MCAGQDFSMQSVQRRIGRMRGERSNNEETVEQEAKIQQLTTELDEKTAVRQHLTEQIKHVNVRHTYSFILLITNHKLHHMWNRKAYG